MLKELFAEYDNMDDKVSQAKQALEEVLKARSDVVRKIGTEIAPKKKLTRGGRELTIVVRGETHFFRGAKSDDDKVVVD